MKKQDEKRWIHWSDLRQTIDKLAEIPADVLEKILAKPGGYEKTKHKRWQRLCERYGINTRPVGRSQRGDYFPEYRARRQLEAVREEHEELQRAHKELQTELARRRVLDAVHRRNVE